MDSIAMFEKREFTGLWRQIFTDFNFLTWCVIYCMHNQADQVTFSHLLLCIFALQENRITTKSAG